MARRKWERGALSVELQRRGMSARDVAESTGWSLATVRQYSCGALTVPGGRAEVLADMLGMTLAEFRQVCPAARRTLAHDILWRRKTRISEVAARHGLAYAQLHNVLSGARPPGPKVASALEAELGLPIEALMTSADDEEAEDRA